MKNVISKLFLSLLVVTPVLVLCHESQKVITIEHALISKVMDGTPRVDVVKMLRIEEGVRDLLSGMNGKPLVSYEDKKYTVNELVQQEQLLKKRHELEKHKRQIKAAIEDALTQFESLTADYMKEAQGWKHQTLSIIEQWSKQRHKPNTLLLQWGQQEEGTEHEELRKMIPDFAHLDSFLEDLESFMRDLRFSCKKSWTTFATTNRIQKGGQGFKKSAKSPDEL